MIDKCGNITSHKYTIKMVWCSSPQKNLLLFITSPFPQQMQSGICNRQLLPPGSFTMINIRKLWREFGYRLAIRNNYHPQNIYSSLSLIKDHICKLSTCKSPWLTRYRMLFLATATTYSSS